MSVFLNQDLSRSKNSLSVVRGLGQALLSCPTSKTAVSTPCAYPQPLSLPYQAACSCSTTAHCSNTPPRNARRCRTCSTHGAKATTSCLLRPLLLLVLRPPELRLISLARPTARAHRQQTFPRQPRALHRGAQVPETGPYRVPLGSRGLTFCFCAVSSSASSSSQLSTPLLLPQPTAANKSL